MPYLDYDLWLNSCETLPNNTCGNETLQACASDECLILNDCSTCLPDAIECVRKLTEYAAAASEDTCFSDIVDFTSAVLFRYLKKPVFKNWMRDRFFSPDVKIETGC